MNSPASRTRGEGWYTWRMRARLLRIIVIWIGAAAVSGVWLAGCADPGSVVGFDEADPAARLRAVRQAGREEQGDRKGAGSVRALVGMLDSDDPAERMLAIRALERRTGQTLGYDHAAEELERRAAVERWVEWCREHEAGED